MRTEAQGAMLVVTGATAVRLIVTDSYLWYLKSSMRIPLLLAGIALLGLGVLTLLRFWRAPAAEAAAGAHDHGDGHDHGHQMTSVAWLLAVPLLVLFLITPAPLGAYAVERETPREPAPVTSPFSPLPEPVDGAVDITLTELMTRSYYDSSGSLVDVPVRLSGFVVTEPPLSDGFRLARFTLSCCAADAFAIQVEVHGLDGPVPEVDTWVEVVGTWIEPPSDASGAQRGVAVRASSVTPIERPTFPYE